MHTAVTVLFQGAAGGRGAGEVRGGRARGLTGWARQEAGGKVKSVYVCVIKLVPCVKEQMISEDQIFFVVLEAVRLVRWCHRPVCAFVCVRVCVR